MPECGSCSSPAICASAGGLTFNGGCCGRAAANQRQRLQRDSCERQRHSALAEHSSHAPDGGYGRISRTQRPARLSWPHRHAADPPRLRGTRAHPAATPPLREKSAGSRAAGASAAAHGPLPFPARGPPAPPWRGAKPRSRRESVDGPRRGAVLPFSLSPNPRSGRAAEAHWKSGGVVE